MNYSQSQFASDKLKIKNTKRTNRYIWYKIYLLHRFYFKSMSQQTEMYNSICFRLSHLYMFYGLVYMVSRWKSEYMKYMQQHMYKY